ncbi:MAG: DNA primase [Planctomycetota bacterium]|jgi:DNA primase
MAVSFDNSIIMQVQNANDIVEVVGEHLSLSKKGREMVGLCPFHDDHKPSFFVNPNKQIYKCFACGAGGNVFTFVQARENLTFPQAVERLANRVGIKLKVKHQTQKTHKPDIDPNELARVNAWAAKYFQKILSDKDQGKHAREYLESRKITIDTAKKWRIGLAPAGGEELLKKARTAKVPEKLLGAAGLTAGANDKLVNRLVFTITDVTGRVIAFGARTLDGQGAKYINSPTSALFDKSNSMFGLEQARHEIVATGTAVVVEGYTDCIMAHQFECKNVVATLGTSFTEGHARILKRYAKKIVLLFDNDTAGIEAANRALEICLAQRIDIKVASVPAGKDPCDFILSEGKEKFDILIENAQDVFDFKWKRMTKSLSKGDNLIDNKAAIEEFLRTIAIAIGSGSMAALDRGLFINKISKITGLSTREIQNDLNRRMRRTNQAASKQTILTENQRVTSISLGSSLHKIAEREILEVLLNEPSLFEDIRERISTQDFEDQNLRPIAEILLARLKEGLSMEIAEVIAGIESVETAGLIVDLADGGQAKGNFEKRLTDAVDAINRLDKKSNISPILAVEDPNNYLKSVSENAGKHNPRNLGII